MKKIFYLIILVCLFSVTNKNLFKGLVYAENNTDKGEIIKPLICVEGEDYSDVLNYEGYSIVYNNVNFNLPGRYKIIYEDSSLEQYTKNVDVISKNSVDKKMYYQVEEKPMFEDSNYTEYINCSLKLDDYLFIVYSYLDRSNDIEILYLSIYQNNDLINTKELGRNKEIIINKLVEYNGNVILVGTKIDVQYDYDLYFEIVDKKGEKLTDSKIIGNEKEEIIDAVVVDNFLYVFGRTASSSGYYIKNVDNDIFIFKMKLDVGIVKKTYVSMLSGTEYLSNVVYTNNHFYFGHSYMENGTLTHHIRKMNLNFEIVEDLVFGMTINFEFCKFVTDDNNIYLLNKDYNNSFNKYICYINTFSKDLNLTYKRPLVFEDYPYVYGKDLSVSDNGTLSMLFELITANNKKAYSLIKEYEQEEILNIIQEDNISVLNFIDLNGNSFFIQKSSKINKVLINSIRVDYFGNTNINNNSFISYNVLVNGEYKNIDNNYSKLNVNKNYFGEYRIVYGFNTEEVLFIYHLDVYVKEKVNIVNKENYDINYILIFNGTGYLNGQLIENNYLVKEEGKYNLELLGNNGVRKYYEFTVSNNGIELKYSDEEIKLDDLNINVSDLNTKVHVDVYQEANQTVGNKNKNNWMLLIPGIILSTAIFLVIKVH